MSRAAVILAPNGHPARQRVRAQYQAVAPGPYRSTVPGTLWDANKDLSRWQRRELVRQSIHWVQNNPLVAGVVERLVTYTVGTGIIPVRASSDKTWNRDAQQYWCEVSHDIEFRQGLSWGEYVSMIWWGRLVCGDILTTWMGDDRHLLTYESHDVTSGFFDGGQQYHDGLTLDALGRVVGYELTGGVKIAAENAVLHVAGLRPKQYRGVPVFAPALMTIHDVADIVALEKQAVKDASSKVDVIETANGEVDDEAVLSGTYTAADGTEKTEYYKTRLGAESIVLRAGDKHTPYVPQRPSPAWQGFMDWLSQMVCLTTGIPPSVVVPVNGTGVDVRRDLATAQRVVDTWQATLANQLRRPCNRIIQLAIDAGDLAGAPADWQRIEWMLPRAITVDSGRDIKADIELVKSGLMTRREFHGLWGQNGEEQDAQVVAEAVARRDALGGATLTVDEFAELLTLTVPKTKEDPTAKEVPTT